MLEFAYSALTLERQGSGNRGADLWCRLGATRVGEVMQEFQAIVGRECDLASLRGEIETAVLRRGSLIPLLEVLDIDGATSFAPQGSSKWQDPVRLCGPSPRYLFGSAEQSVRRAEFPASGEDPRLFWIRVVMSCFREERSGPPEFVGSVAAEDLLSGAENPSADSWRRTLGATGLDRLSLLKDPEIVDPGVRALFLAGLSGRLEAERAVVDLVRSRRGGADSWLVTHEVLVHSHVRSDPVPNVILGGAFLLVGSAPTADHIGLGDDPSNYELSGSPHGIILGDRTGQEATVQTNPGDALRRLALAKNWLPRDGDERLAHLASTVGKENELPLTRARLKQILRILGDRAPIPAARLLFAEDLLGSWHAEALLSPRADAYQVRACREALLEADRNVDGLGEDAVRALGHLLLESALGPEPTRPPESRKQPSVSEKVR